ncbi:hypothetical protein CCACVL1_20779, partial [Corchorus capsularis]
MNENGMEKERESHSAPVTGTEWGHVCLKGSYRAKDPPLGNVARFDRSVDKPE